MADRDDDDLYDDEYESEDALGAGADEAVESEHRESIVLLIDASPEMLLPYDGSAPPAPPPPPPARAAAAAAAAHPSPPPLPLQQSSLHVALELAYSLMRNLLTSGSRDEIAVLFYGLAPPKEGGRNGGGGDAAAAAEGAEAGAVAAAAAADPAAVLGLAPTENHTAAAAAAAAAGFEGVVPLHPLSVPGADAMRRLRDLWRGDRARFEAQVGRIYGSSEEEEGEDDDEQGGNGADEGGAAVAVAAGTQPTLQASITNQQQQQQQPLGDAPSSAAAAAAALAAKRAVRSGTALRMGLWAARDTLRQQGGGSRAVARTAGQALRPGGGGGGAGALMARRRVLVLSAAEDPTAPGGGRAAASGLNLTSRDQAAAESVLDQVLERAAEIGALGASLEVVPLGALRRRQQQQRPPPTPGGGGAGGGAPASSSLAVAAALAPSSSSPGIDMESFWNPLMRRAREAMEPEAARGGGGGAAGAAATAATTTTTAADANADNDDLAEEEEVDGAEAAAMPAYFTPGRVEERIGALMAHMLRVVHRRRPLARSAIVLPALLLPPPPLGGASPAPTPAAPAAAPAAAAAVAIPVAVYSLVARPSTLKPAVLVAARNNEPLRVSTALQCADTAAALTEVTHYAYRPSRKWVGRGGEEEGREAAGAAAAAASSRLPPSRRYPDVVVTAREASSMRAAGPGRDAPWLGGDAAAAAAALAGAAAAAAAADDDEGNGKADAADDGDDGDDTDPLSNPAALAAGCYVYLGSKPLSALSDAHQLMAPVFLYPDEKKLLQQGGRRRGGGGGGGGGSSIGGNTASAPPSNSITAAFSALHRALLETGRFAVCRSGRRSAAGGGGAAGLRLAALVPQAERLCTRTGRQLQPSGFHAIALPYREDMRFPELAPLPGVDKALKQERLLATAAAPAIAAAAAADYGGGNGGNNSSNTADALDHQPVPYFATELQVRAAEALIARLTFMGGEGGGVQGPAAAVPARWYDDTTDPPPFYPTRAINPVLERHRQLVEAAALGERPPCLVWEDSGWGGALGGGGGGGGQLQQQQQRLLTAPDHHHHHHDAGGGGAAALLLEAPPPRKDGDDDGGDAVMGEQQQLPRGEFFGGDEEDDDEDDHGEKKQQEQLATTATASQQQRQQQQAPPVAVVRVRDLDGTLPDPAVFGGAADMLAAFCDACGIGRAGRQRQAARAAAAASGALPRELRARQMMATDAEAVAVLASFDWPALARATPAGGAPAGGGLYALTVDQLKTYLKTHALPLAGKKADVVSRVREHALSALSAGAAAAAALPLAKRRREEAATAAAPPPDDDDDDDGPFVF